MPNVKKNRNKTRAHSPLTDQGFRCPAPISTNSICVNLPSAPTFFFHHTAARSRPALAPRNLMTGASQSSAPSERPSRRDQSRSLSLSLSPPPWGPGVSNTARSDSSDFDISPSELCGPPCPVLSFPAAPCGLSAAGAAPAAADPAVSWPPCDRPCHLLPLLASLRREELALSGLGLLDVLQ